MIEKILERLEEERECSYADFEEYLMKYEIDNEFSSDDDWFYFGLKRAKTIVQEVAKEYEDCEVMRSNCEVADGGWIPCSERLPENDFEDVLVWFEYFRYGDYQRPYQMHGISYTFHGEWSGFVNGTSGWQQLRVIAWQPLPAPYQKGE